MSGRDDGNRVHVFPSMLPDGTSLVPGDFAHVLADRAEGATLVGVALRRAAGAGDRPLVDAETGAARWAAETPLVAAAASSRARPPVATRAFSTMATAGGAIDDILAAKARRAPAAAVLGIAKDATGRDARDAFLTASRLVHPDVCTDGRAGAAFAALVEAYDAFAPSDIKYDISQAEFQAGATL